MAKISQELEEKQILCNLYKIHGNFIGISEHYACTNYAKFEPTRKIIKPTDSKLDIRWKCVNNAIFMMQKLKTCDNYANLQAKDVIALLNAAEVLQILQGNKWDTNNKK